MANHVGATEAPNSGYIKRLLKNYLASADRSLSGPDRAARSAKAASMDASTTDSKSSAMLSIPKPSGNLVEPASQTSVAFRVPVFLVQDNSPASVRKSETVVRGHVVACFDVGGEKRICVPHLLKTVLHDFTIDEINAACEELCVHCSQCTEEQITVLKAAGILPPGTASAGLMTKSQAERLCRHLFEQKYGAGPAGVVRYHGEAFKVYHECFGKSKGILYSDRYIHPDAACIECCQCSCLMSPADFVCHGHKGLELRTCHWGFDATKWRAYLLVAREHRDDIEPLKARLEELKARFLEKERGVASSAVKRKELDSSLDRCGGEKRARHGTVTVMRMKSEGETACVGGDVLTTSADRRHLNPAATSDDVRQRDKRLEWKGQIITAPITRLNQESCSQTKNVIQLNKQLVKEEPVALMLSSRRGQEANTERRQLVDLLQLATNESVPVATRQKLAENVLQLFDQRNQIVVRLLQENNHLLSKLQLAISLEAKYKAALADLEGAEGLAALSSPRSVASSGQFTFSAPQSSPSLASPPHTALC